MVGGTGDPASVGDIIDETLVQIRMAPEYYYHFQ